MNTYQSQQFWNSINSVIGFTTSILVMGFMVGMVKSLWPEEKYRLVKRTKRGSLVVIHQEGDKAIIELPNLEDIIDLSNLLNATRIKWEIHDGISKSAWEGTPAYLRSPKPTRHKITDPYPGKTIEFNFSDLELVMSQMKLSSPLLEEPKEHHSSSNITTQEVKGTCYQDAWRYVMHHIEGILVHGTVVGLRGRMNHAWVELPDGTVWEPASQAIMPIGKYYALVDPIVEDRYTADEAARMLNVGKHGPWTDEERARWLGEHHSNGGSNMEIERRHGFVVKVGGVEVRSVNLPDWSLDYVEYPPGKRVEFRDALQKARVRTVKFTDTRIYFEQA